MDELIKKLTNLSYELFGIIIPGAILTLYFFIWWGSLGNAPESLSNGYFRTVTVHQVLEFTKLIFTQDSAGLLFPLIFSWYILGHITQWFSKTTKFTKSDDLSTPKRIWSALIFKPARPKASYSSELDIIFETLSKRLSPSQEPLTWNAFFPIAKNFVSRNSTSSLITNYQNKYTLHRSITITSAALFWANLLCLIISTLTPQTDTNTPLQILLIPFTLFMVWGFSGGYETNWKLFGNSIITETYSLIEMHTPDSVKDKNE